MTASLHAALSELLALRKPIEFSTAQEQRALHRAREALAQWEAAGAGVAPEHPGEPVDAREGAAAVPGPGEAPRSATGLPGGSGEAEEQDAHEQTKRERHEATDDVASLIREHDAALARIAQLEAALAEACEVAEELPGRRTGPLHARVAELRKLAAEEGAK